MRASKHMLSFGVLVLAGYSASARAEVQAGAIDWKTHSIRCRGIATPPPTASTISQARLLAEKSARQDAVRNVVETLKNVPITGSRTCADLLGDAATRSKVEGAARNYRLVDTRYFSDGGVEVEVEVTLDQVMPALDGVKVVEPATVKSSEADVVPVSAPETKVTGASQH